MSDKIAGKTRKHRERSRKFARESRGHHRTAAPGGFGDENAVRDTRDQAVARFEAKPAHGFERRIRAHEHAARIEHGLHPFAQVVREETTETARQKHRRRFLRANRREMRGLIGTSCPAAHDGKVAVAEEGRKMAFHPALRARGEFAAPDDREPSRRVQSAHVPEAAQERRRLFEFEKRARIKRVLGKKNLRADRTQIAKRAIDIARIDRSLSRRSRDPREFTRHFFGRQAPPASLIRASCRAHRRCDRPPFAFL